ncbi:MAG: metallophosphoesterase [Planctomycetaceae bacterium]
MAKEFYRFIHLSDIHFGQEKNGTLVIHEDARQKLIEDCAVFVRDHGPADGILVVGDIAFGGQPAEYKKAADWLKAVAKAGGCEEFAVRTIPGNHDIDRKKVEDNKYCRSRTRKFVKSPSTTWMAH